MRWHFPLADPHRRQTQEESISHVLSEVREFESETDIDKKALEALDILHCAETLVRKFFQEYPQLSIEKTRHLVEQKNRQRGYYTDGRGA